QQDVGRAGAEDAIGDVGVAVLRVPDFAGAVRIDLVARRPEGPGAGCGAGKLGRGPVTRQTGAVIIAVISYPVGAEGPPRGARCAGLGSRVPAERAMREAPGGVSH